MFRGYRKFTSFSAKRVLGNGTGFFNIQIGASSNRSCYNCAKILHATSFNAACTIWCKTT